MPVAVPAAEMLSIHEPKLQLRVTSRVCSSVPDATEPAGVAYVRSASTSAATVVQDVIRAFASWPIQMKHIATHC
jgi:hypothetical protein